MRRAIKEFLVKELMINAIYNGYFMRLDIVVNYIGIEAHYGNNIWALYEKYEKTSGRDANKSKNKFISLIQSFEDHGCLSKKYPLMISDNQRLHVRDGAHRLACALYFNNENISGYIKNPTSLTDIGSRLFRRRGFTESEIAILEKKKNSILKKIG